MVKRMTTKDFLFESFKELAKEKQLDDISINDIVENSQISRATFYRYFRDKFDLMEQYYQHEIEMIADDLYESDNLKKMQEDFNEFIFENLELFENLGKYEGQNNIFDIVYMYCVNMHIRQAQKYYQSEDIPEELLFAIFYHASGGVAMMKKIIINKELDLTKEQYTYYYKNCMPSILKEIYKV